jgi:hypothetical protein
VKTALKATLQAVLFIHQGTTVTTQPINHLSVSSTYRATIKRIGTIPNDTSDDAEGQGRHFKSGEPESLPLAP